LLTHFFKFFTEGKPEEGLTPEKKKEYSEAKTIFYGAVVGVLAETVRYVHSLQNH
jgi:hypothetical protein